jgi:hypothetical protein
LATRRSRYRATGPPAGEDITARLLKQRTKPVNPLPEINVRIGGNLLDHFMDSTSHIIV